jgi:4-oxalocrotonate tautomerase
MEEDKMPIVTVKMAKGRPVEKKRSLVKAITNTVAKELDLKPEWVTVLIEEYDRKNWATGGKLHSDKFGSGFGKKGVLKSPGARK